MRHNRSVAIFTHFRTLGQAILSKPVVHYTVHTSFPRRDTIMLRTAATRPSILAFSHNLIRRYCRSPFLPFLYLPKVPPRGILALAFTSIVIDPLTEKTAAFGKRVW